jgi:hypothetical protein
LARRTAADGISETMSLDRLLHCPDNRANDKKPRYLVMQILSIVLSNTIVKMLYRFSVVPFSQKRSSF